MSLSAFVYVPHFEIATDEENNNTISDFNLDHDIETFYSIYPSLNLKSQIHYWNIYKTRLDQSYNDMITVDSIINYTKLLQCYDVYINIPKMPLVVFDNITYELIDICNKHLYICQNKTHD
jgi:hypothetical protein